MKFSDPWWLLAGLVTGLVFVGVWRHYDLRQRAALARFLGPALQLRLTGTVSPARRFIQRALFMAATLCLFTALAGPELGFHWETISRRGNEVVFAIDTSRSMLTPDVKPDRMTRAKLAIDDMARQLEGDGVGIVAFAGSAFLVCPLTFDSGAFHQALDAVDVHTIPLGGTNISAAILAARAALRRRPGTDRILILVTDGENLEGDALAAAKEAAEQDALKIYTVGVGTAEGDLIPLPLDQGGGFVKDEAGALVRSHLDEGALKAIASATGGDYVHLGGQGEDFAAFLATVFRSVTKHDLVYRQRKVYTPRYQWPLAAALGLLWASLLVSTRRSRRRRTAVVPRVIAVSAVVAILVGPVRSESAEPTSSPGGAANAQAPLVEYTTGTAAYRAGQFSAATRDFQQSIRAAPASDAKRLADQEDTYYNLGNARYRAGQQLEKSNPQEAIKEWTEAVKAYDTALQLRRDDADSKFNRDFVQRKIDALRQPPNPDGGGGGGGGGGQGRGGGKGSGQGQGQSQGQGQGNNQGQPPPAAEGRGSPPGQQTAQASPASKAPPGKMSAEEARELLDSAKSSEHSSLPPLAAGPRDPNSAPDKPVKNW
jgi:Ca-activated chloride channel family protein